jgi:hypothetical protein
MKIKNKPLRPGDDASDAQFFELNNLPYIAFESHIKIINKYKELTT